MHHRRFYTLGFLAVVAVALAGGYLVFRSVGPIEVPRFEVVTTVQEALADLNLSSLIPPISLRTEQPEEADAALSEQDEQPAEQVVDTAGPAEEQPDALDREVAGRPATATPERPTPTQAPPTPTPTPAGQSQVSMPFLLAGTVRHSSGDCPSPSIRGVVRDLAGNPLSGVRLWRYDQWGNEQVVETKVVPEEQGQYDFPLGDTPNMHYVQVIDAGGTIVSPVVEVAHRQGEAQDATCHWIDWLRQ